MSNQLIINESNYEEIMFDLLEKVYSPAEEKLLLEQILSNPFFRFEWEQWQKSKLNNPIIPEIASETYWENIKNITKSTASKKRVFWINKPAVKIAAAVLPFILFAFWFFTRNDAASAGANTFAAKEIKGQGPTNTGKSESEINPILESSNTAINASEMPQTKAVNSQASSTDLIKKDSLHLSKKIEILPAPETVVKTQPEINTNNNTKKTKRFNIAVTNVQSTAAVASANPKKPSKMKDLFTNPQIKKYRSESGEVWLEISGDGGSVFAKTTEITEK